MPILYDIAYILIVYPFIVICIYVYIYMYGINSSFLINVDIILTRCVFSTNVCTYTFIYMIVYVRVFWGYHDNV